MVKGPVAGPGAGERLFTRIARFALMAVAFLVPVENVFVVADVGTMAKVAGVAAALLTALAVVERGWWRRSPAALLCCALFVVWASASVMWAPVSTLAIGRMLTFWQLLILVACMWQVVITEDQLASIGTSYILGAAVSAALIGLNALQGRAILDERFVAGGFDPNDQGLLLALGLPIVAQRGVLGGRKAQQWFWWLVLALIIVAIPLTGSRGALIAASVGLMAVVLGGEWGWRRRLVSAAVIGLAGWTARQWLSDSLFVRLATMRDEITSGTFGNRGGIWQAALSVISSHPLLGVGLAGSRDALHEAGGTGRVAHNTLLAVGVETGLIGVAFFGLALAVTVRPILRGDLQQRATYRAMWLVWVLGASSLSWEYAKGTWLLIAMTVACSATALQGRPRPAAPASQQTAA